MRTWRLVVYPAVIVVAVLFSAACGGSGEKAKPTEGPNPPQGAVETAGSLDVTPTVAPTPTPAPKPAITLDDAPSYLNVSDILPGFARLDPRQEGGTKEDVWGLQMGNSVEQFSELQLYLSEKPFQYMWIMMGVFPSRAELASWKAVVRDEKTFSQQFVQGFVEAFTARSGLKDVPEPSMTCRDVAVGDFARLCELSLVYQGGQIQMDVVLMFQENTVVLIYDMWYPAEPATVDILTVARTVSSRIANR